MKILNKENSILENQTLYMKNVLSYRGKVTQMESMQISKQIDDIIRANNATKDGAVVTVTHSIKMNDGQPVMDLEMKIPLDKPVVVTDNFEFIPEFVLENTLKARHIGNPQLLEGKMNELKEYMDSHNLTPMSPAYIATVKEAKTQAEIDDMIIDVYVVVR